jgi:hypothetical protein
MLCAPNDDEDSETQRAEGLAYMSSLLTVMGGRIELEPNRSYILGRSAKCDLVVQDHASSRRHARLTLGGAPRAVFLEDLESRNGTYVNGDRIDGRTHLDDGSRIRIGATIYLLSLMDDAGNQEDLIDSGTMAIEHLSFGNDVDEEILRVVDKKGRVGTEFAGQLGAFSLIEVLQLLISTGRSGTLHVALESGHAKVEIRKGDVCTANFQELDGFQALLMLVRQKHGIFWLQETSALCRNTIRQPANRLLFELCRALDEKETVQ